MLQVSGIELHFGGRTLFDGVGFQANAGERIGLAGRNGAGKSTLMKVIAGFVQPEKGSVSLAGEARIGYLEQDAEELSAGTVMDAALSGFTELKNAELRLDKLNDELTQRQDYESDEYMALIEEVSHLSERLAVLDASRAEEEAERILTGLGFDRDALRKPVKELSGGWRMRVVLARLLVSKPDILLLDEPTNHLDIESIFWLEKFLKNFQGVIILVSHDRHFLDSVTNRTVEVSAGKVRDYKLPYTKYLDKREEEREIEERAFNNQQKYIKQTEQLIDKFRAKASKASFAQSLIKKLDRLERVEIEDDSYNPMNLRFPEAPASGRIVVEGKTLNKAYPGKPIFSAADFVINVGEKVALVGKNGMGKTTLIRLILGNEAPDSGTIETGYNVRVGYYAQDAHEHLNPNDTVFDTIDRLAKGDMRTRVRGLLGSFLFSGDDIEKKVGVLSGGEKSRLVLCSLMLEKYNFLILDEPTNHLDILSKEVLKEALRKYTGSLLIVSHDREFLNGLTDRVFEIYNRRIAVHFGGIEEHMKRLEDRDKANKTPAKRSNVEAEAPRVITPPAKKEDKTLQNKIAKLEREIDQAEGELKKLEEMISNLDFSKKDESGKALNSYQEKKAAVDKLYAELEQLI
jgi:ATP-binding cassette subfamily F protein 3